MNREELIQIVKQPVQWIEERTGVIAFSTPLLFHHVPRSAKWWYVFGSATLMFFTIQIVTGVCLGTMYAPSASNAWESLRYIDEEIPLGWMLRALHGWSSSAMVVMMAIHMLQVFMHGSFKFPRELNWITGVFLLLTVLALAFTGQVMRWDQDAYWGLGIGAAIVDRVPVFGDQMRALMLGGPIIGGETLNRFFALHVFILPGAAIGLVGVHMTLIMKNGISEMPKPGEIVVPSTYRKGFEERMEKSGVPFFPDAAQRDMVFCGVCLILLVFLAAYYGPFGPGGMPDPTLINTNPRPDYPFMWIFGAVSLLPPASETAIMLISPVVGIAILVAVPFLSNSGERAPSRRPGMMLLAVFVVMAIVALTWEGVTSPWSPVMDGWSALPTPTQFVKGRTPLQMQGAVVFQYAQCRNCHELGGFGGKRGPALDEIATRMSPDQIVRQVQQGGGNMPAFGKNLNSAQMTTIVGFLSTLRPANEADSTIPGAQLPLPIKSPLTLNSPFTGTGVPAQISAGVSSR
jgi:ubiquinol-cytochrome c reductase cytochrome b subunit